MVHDGPDPADAAARDAEDRALVTRIANGDRVALELLYERHAPWLTGRLQSRCGDPDVTDTAVQDTFLAIWKSAKSYRREGEVGAWIWGIGIRRLIDLLRRRRATPFDPALVAAMGDLGGSHRRGPGDAGPEEAVIDAMGVRERHKMAQALATMPAELRAVLVATAIDGLTTKEAARLLGVPQGTVKTRLMRARHQLQEALS